MVLSTLHVTYSFSPHKLYEVATSSPILLMKKLRQWEVKKLVQQCKGIKWQNQDVKPSYLNLQPSMYLLLNYSAIHIFHHFILVCPHSLHSWEHSFLLFLRPILFRWKRQDDSDWRNPKDQSQISAQHAHLLPQSFCSSLSPRTWPGTAIYAQHIFVEWMNK